MKAGFYAALFLGGLLCGSPALAGNVWADGAVAAATMLATQSVDRRGEYDDRGPWVSGPATAGRWLGEGVGIALGLPVGVISFPVWLGIAAASEKFEATQALQLSLLTGGTVYDACASGGYHVVGAPLARVQGPKPKPAEEDPSSRLPPSKLRP